MLNKPLSLRAFLAGTVLLSAVRARKLHGRYPLRGAGGFGSSRRNVASVLRDAVGK